MFNNSFITYESRKLAKIGEYSTICMYLLLLSLTIIGGVPYSEVFNGILQLVTGNVSQISSGNETILQTILTIVSVVLITIPITVIVSSITNGNTKSFNIELLDKQLDKGPFAHFQVIALEEVITRGFFLGLMTKVFTSDFGFYAMFMLGNFLWAAIHLVNYKDGKERSILRVIPQFVGGVTNTYIFVRYGLFAVIMAHFLYNIILLATRKEKMPTSDSFHKFVYYTCLLIASYILMSIRDVQMVDLLVWLTESVNKLEGYTFWDYAVVLLAVDAVIGIVASVLLLDSAGIRRTNNLIKDDVGFVFVVGMIVLVLLHVGIILILNWLLSFILDSSIVRSIVIATFISLMTGSYSGSSMAKATAVNLPANFFTVAAFVTLGFWPAMGLGLIFFVVHYYPLYVKSD